MKKLAIVISSLEVGGAERMVLDLIKAIKDNITVKLYIIKSNMKTIYDKEASKLGVELVYFNHRIKIFSFLVAIKFFKEMKRFKPDIIHSHLKSSFYVFLYNIFHKNFRWIHTVHTLANVDIKFVRRLFYKKVINNKRMELVAVSDNVLESIRYYFNNASVVKIPNGIHLEKFYNNDLKEINIISIARFDKVKNHEYMLLELKPIIDKVNKIFLIGDGKLRRKIFNLIKTYKMEDKVVIINFTNRTANYLANSTIYLSTSLYEGLSLSVIEALASGLVVIASKASNELILNNYNGFLINLEQNELTNKLNFVINNLKKLNNIRENAKLYASNFSIENMKNRYLQLYFEE